MRAKFRPYAAQDRMKVREFLSSTYAKLQRPNTWTVASAQHQISDSAILAELGANRS